LTTDRHADNHLPLPRQVSDRLRMARSYAVMAPGSGQDIVGIRSPATLQPLVIYSTILALYARQLRSRKRGSPTQPDKGPLLLLGGHGSVGSISPTHKAYDLAWQVEARQIMCALSSEPSVRAVSQVLVDLPKQGKARHGVLQTWRRLRRTAEVA